jgi:hypothetical protein
MKDLSGKRTILPLKPKDPQKPGRSLGDELGPDKKEPDLTLEDMTRPMTSQDLEELNSINPKVNLTERETKLIELFLSYPLEHKWKIAKLAGFKCSSKQALINAFNIVMEKYESQEDAQEIFRKVGIGEARIALRIRQLMEQDKNLTVALNAYTLAAKCQKLTKDGLDLPPGFAVNIMRAEKQTAPTDTGPHRKLVQPGPKATITK